MSRTDELRDSGARSVAGGGSDDPFVRWGDSPAWVEGEVLGFWDGRYGEVMSLRVTNASNTARAGDPDNPDPIREDQEVNVGLNSVLLKDVPEKVGVGAEVHVAFVGWEQSDSSGNKYRLFEVLEIEPGDSGPARSNGGPEKPSREDKDLDGAPRSGGPGVDDEVPPPGEDDLPF